MFQPDNPNEFSVASVYQERTYGLGFVITKEDSVDPDRDIAVNPIEIKTKILK